MISPNSFDTLRKNRRRAPVYGKVLVVVSILIVLFVVLRWRETAAALFWKVAAPVSVLRNSIDHSSLNNLKAELASTSAALADRNALQIQNTELKRLLGRQIVGVQIIAGVILRPPGTPYDTLMIDAGKAAGVVPGELVFGGGNSAIGEVTEVYANVSRVTLFSAPGRSFDAQVTPKATPGAILPLTLEGQGAGSMLGKVPAGSKVVMGDSVVIPGMGSAFVGSVTHIDAPEGSSFETLLVQLPVDLFSLQFVEVQTHL